MESDGFELPPQLLPWPPVEFAQNRREISGYIPALSVPKYTQPSASRPTDLFDSCQNALNCTYRNVMYQKFYAINAPDLHTGEGLRRPT